MGNLHWRSLVIGFVVGAAASAALFWYMGEDVKGSAAKATEALGEGVQRAGEQIEKTGKKMR